MSFRTGLGFDAHAFQEGRKLVLGGVQVPYARGLAGHSDADVLTHALMDALLGACGEKDIGEHFPDRDPAYQGISSLVLLEEVAGLLRERNYRVVNADCVIVAEEPRLAPYIQSMREVLAFTLGIEIVRVGVQATTTEGMGFAGRGEGIAAMATVLLQKPET